ncbi:MAG: CcdB family protein [Deltaproteobacteria bacterium]|nr:CcdB family protein [Deltaproteobacteria bacterium]
MSRLTLYKNHLKDLTGSYPYLLDIQNDQIQAGTRIVALVRNSGKIADIAITTLRFSYAGEQYSASLLDLLTVSERKLSPPLAQLDHLKAALTNAVDFIFVD